MKGRKGVRSNWKTERQKGREENMRVTKGQIPRTTKGIKERKTGGGCGIMIHEIPHPHALNLVTLQKATAQNGCCIF